MVDWRRQIQHNERHTKIVIAMFFLLYAMLGLLVDITINTNLQACSWEIALNQIFTGYMVPWATLVLSIIAIISVVATFAYHDKIALLGLAARPIAADILNGSDNKERQLCNMVEELRLAAGLRYTPKTYIIEADYMNAFASGYSEKSALIAVTRGLLDGLERNELQAVLAHELSHIRHQDIKLTLMVSVLANLMVIILDLAIRGFFNAGGRNTSAYAPQGGQAGERKSGNGGGRILMMVIFLLLRLILPLVTAVMFLYLSRSREFMADAGAVELLRDNQALAKALITISRSHANNPKYYSQIYQCNHHEEIRAIAYIFDPQEVGIKLKNTVTNLFSTHPPLKARLKALGVNPPPDLALG